MKIGMRQSDYVSAFGFEEGIFKMKEHGYDCIDYQNFISTKTAFFNLERTAFEKTLLRERATFERAGLFVHQAHAPFGFPVRDGTVEERAERFAEMKKALYGTAVLGADTFVMHPLSPFTLERVDPEEETAKINAEFISRLAEYAKELGITVCVENLPFVFYTLSHCKALDRLVRHIDFDNVKLCLDTGHVNHLSYAKNVLGVGIDGVVPCELTEAVHIFSDKLGTCHIHQNMGDSDAHAPLDKGSMDMEAFVNALRSVHYHGVFSLEVAMHFESHPESEWDSFGRSVFETASKLANG